LKDMFDTNSKNEEKEKWELLLQNIQKNSYTRWCEEHINSGTWDMYIVVILM